METDNKKQVKINKDKLSKTLKGRSIRWLNSELKDNNIKIEYNALCSNLRNEVEWKLTYAYYICKILECNIEDLFDTE